MIATDRNSLICDLAETYHIFNYRELPPRLVATLSVGLRDNSRIKMKLSNSKVPLETLLSASILDNTRMLLWAQSKDAQKGRNRPKSIVEQLLKVDKPKEYKGTNSVEEFKKLREKMMKGGI